VSKSNWDKGFTSGAKAARKTSANSVCTLCCDGCKEHGERVERERIIKIVAAYLDPKYSEAWRPYYDEIARNLIPRIRGENK